MEVSLIPFNVGDTDPSTEGQLLIPDALKSEHAYERTISCNY